MSHSLIRSMSQGFGVAVALCITSGANATSVITIFQSVPDLYDFAAMIPGTGVCSDCHGVGKAYDTFSLSAEAEISGFALTLLDTYGEWPATVEFSVWTIGNNGKPGVGIFAQTLPAGDFSTDFRVGPGYSFINVISTVNVSGLQLGPGSYYASFYNSNLLVPAVFTTGSGNLYSSCCGGYFYPGESMGFALLSPVPETPNAAMLIAGIGTLGLFSIFARRRRLDNVS